MDRSNDLLIFAGIMVLTCFYSDILSRQRSCCQAKKEYQWKEKTKWEIRAKYSSHL